MPIVGSRAQEKARLSFSNSGLGFSEPRAYLLCGKNQARAFEPEPRLVPPLLWLHDRWLHVDTGSASLGLELGQTRLYLSSPSVIPRKPKSTPAPAPRKRVRARQLVLLFLRMPPSTLRPYVLPEL